MPGPNSSLRISLARITQKLGHPSRAGRSWQLSAHRGVVPIAWAGFAAIGLHMDLTSSPLAGRTGVTELRLTPITSLTKPMLSSADAHNDACSDRIFLSNWTPARRYCILQGKWTHGHD